MKKITILSILVLSFFCASAPPPDETILSQKRLYALSELKRWAYEKEFQKFIDHLGFKESSDNWTAINQINCIGKFQFAPGTLKHLGYNIGPEEFKANPDIFPEELQERVLRELIRSNELVLQSCMDHIGKVMFGVRITKSGMLGAAHLAGAEGVRIFLTTGYIARDINGTSVLDYMREFQGYEI